MKAPIFPLVLVAALAAPAAAAEYRIELDPANTSVTFTLGATLHTVHGKAAVISGSILYDETDGRLTGEVDVDATTAETGNHKRDKKMHTKVLMSSDHPHVVLRPQQLDGELHLQGSSECTILGQMEILGQAHEITIPLKIQIVDDRFTATGDFEVPYVTWGLTDPSTFVLRVAKVVTVSTSAEGTIRISGDSP
jgi:polyisoprenoid-binding protein YceI